MYIVDSKFEINICFVKIREYWILLKVTSLNFASFSLLFFFNFFFFFSSKILSFSLSSFFFFFLEDIKQVHTNRIIAIFDCNLCMIKIWSDIYVTRKMAHAARTSRDLELIFEEISCTGNLTAKPLKGDEGKKGRKQGSGRARRANGETFLHASCLRLTKTYRGTKFLGIGITTATTGLFVPIQPVKVHLCSRCVSGRIRFKGLFDWWNSLCPFDCLMRALRAKGFE